MSPSADLLVIGGGVAGTAAAARAAERGAKVTVVEKDTRLGGSGALSAGILWTAPDLETLRRVCPDGDPELGRALVDGFEGAVELARAAGVEVSDRWHGQMGFGVANRIDIHGLLDTWREQIEASGGEIRFETAARELITEANGAVGGAKTEGPGGGERIDAAATLIATGGFQGDGERVRELIGRGAERIIVRSAPHSTGDGLRMALESGAALSGSLDTFYGHLLPRPIDDLRPEDYLPLTQYHSKACILVNRFGRRFTDESRGDEVSNQYALRQRGAEAYLLCDEAVRAEHAVEAPYPHGQVVDRFEVAERAGGRIANAATIDELTDIVAGWGVNGPALRETLDRYEAAAAGADVTLDAPLPAEPRPLREPPFWALEVQPSITFPFGGLRADADGRVLDAGGEPVPGLLAAGADMGGLQDTGYVGGLVLGLVFGPRAADAALDGDGGAPKDRSAKADEDAEKGAAEATATEVRGG